MLATFIFVITVTFFGLYPTRMKNASRLMLALENRIYALSLAGITNSCAETRLSRELLHP